MGRGADGNQKPREKENTMFASLIAKAEALAATVETDLESLWARFEAFVKAEFEGETKKEEAPAETVQGTASASDAAGGASAAADAPQDPAGEAGATGEAPAAGVAQGTGTVS